MSHRRHAPLLGRFCALSCFVVPLLSAAGARAEQPSARVAFAPDASEGHWQVSMYGSWLPGIGEAKRGAFEGGPPGPELGYGLRMERSLHDWWSAGLVLSSQGWKIDAPQEATGVLSSGSFVDAALMVKFHPLSFTLGSGPLGVYLAVAGGPTLGGDRSAAAVVTNGGATSSTNVDFVSFEAGYNASGWLGASWLPTEHLGLFVEGGIDWHFAVHTQSSVDFAAGLAASDQPRAIAEKLWLGQGMVNVGVFYRF